MGFLFKKQWTAPLPPQAEIVVIKGVRTARWRTRSGKLRTAEVIDGADGRLRIRGRTAAYLARFKNADDVWVEVPTGCKDEVAARAVLVNLEKQAERVRAGVLSGEEVAVAEHARTPIADHLESYVSYLKLKGSTEHRLKQVRARLTRVFNDCGIKRLPELDPVPVEQWLVDRQNEDMAAATRNEYRLTLVAFSNWCMRSGRLLVNRMKSLPRADANADRRHVRRALTEAELEALLHAAMVRPLHEALLVRRGARAGTLAAKVRPEIREQLEALGRERALLYKLLALTGLRKGELASLTVGDVYLDEKNPYLSLEAAKAKNRTDADIPLRADLVEDIGDHLAEQLEHRRREAARRGDPMPSQLAPDCRLLNVPSGLIRIFDRDLLFAGLARVERRDGRDVIAKVDARGMTLDVHALRVTFCTHLSKAGVPLRTAQAAMRHSDPSLTARVYTDPKLLDVAGAIEALPSLPLRSRKAKGTRMQAI